MEGRREEGRREEGRREGGRREGGRREGRTFQHKMEVREGGRRKGGGKKGGREGGREGRTVQHQDGGEHILSSIGLLYSEGHSIVNPFELKGVAFVTVLIQRAERADSLGMAGGLG